MAAKVSTKAKEKSPVMDGKDLALKTAIDQIEKNSTSFYNFGNQFLKKLLKETNSLSS